MRLVLVPSYPTVLDRIHFTLVQALLTFIIEAEARYRGRCRLANLPPERLRDMGLKGSAHRPPNLPHQTGCLPW
jgi:hypothetical protein